MNLILDLLKNEKLTVGLKLLGIGSMATVLYTFILSQIVFLISPDLLELLKIVYGGGPETPASWLEVSTVIATAMFKKGLWLGLILGAFGFWINTNQPYFKVKLWSVAVFFGTLVISGVIVYTIAQFAMPSLYEFLKRIAMDEIEELQNYGGVHIQYGFLSAVILIITQYLTTMPALLFSCLYQYKKLTKVDEEYEF